MDALARQGDLIRIDHEKSSLLLTKSGWESLIKKAVDAVQDYHEKFPTRPGIPAVELGNRLKLGTNSPAALSKLVADGVLAGEGTTVRLPAHEVRLTSAQQEKVDAFLDSLVKNPYTPPGGLIPAPDLLNLLVEQGRVVKLSESVVFLKSTYDEVVQEVTARIESQGKITLAEVRDMFGTSRKYAQALLEYLDGKKITRRLGDERVLY